jgi:hypothetical protein
MNALITSSLAEAVAPVPMNGDLGRRDRLRLRHEEARLVELRLFGPEGREAEHVLPAAIGAEQIAHQFGDRDQAAAIIAVIDDHLRDACVPEALEGLAQGGIGGVDEGAQIDVTDAPSAFLDDPRAVAAGNRRDREIRLGDGDVSHAARILDAKHAGGAGGIGAKRTRNAALGSHDIGGAAQIGLAGADRQDLGAAIDAGRQGRRAFKGFGNEDPAGSGVRGQAHAEAGGLARLEKGVLLAIEVTKVKKRSRRCERAVAVSASI